MKFISWFDTDLGLGAVLATECGICNVLLPPVDRDNSDYITLAGDTRTSPMTVHAAELLTRYFKGLRQSFADIPLDLGEVTAFRARILMMIRAIPSGETRTYGEIALMAGVPRAARAIGGAMASNPVPIIIPCHRVIAGNGRLTGFTAPGGLGMKKFLLQMEGVEFKGELICQEK